MVGRFVAFSKDGCLDWYRGGRVEEEKDEHYCFTGTRT